MDSLVQNLRYALRQLRRSPGVTAVAVLSLALGIGVTVGIYSLFDQILIRPLPVPDPDGLVNLVSPGPKTGWVSSGNEGDGDAVFSYPMFRDLQRAETRFTGIVAHRTIEANLAYRDQNRSGQAILVSGRYFPVLAVRPALGRLLGPEDDRTVGESRVVVLSYAYWQMLADEPTGSLHWRQGEQIMELLSGLNADGTTIIQVTHDERVAAFGTRVIELADGWIAADRRI